jgi:hypothetical protein
MSFLKMITSLSEKTSSFALRNINVAMVGCPLEISYEMRNENEPHIAMGFIMRIAK